MMLILTIAVAFLRYGLLRLSMAFQRRAITPQDRAAWMQQCNRLAVRAMGIRYRVEGLPPTSPTLIAGNHLSYLDIVIASAAVSCAFVSKHEIAGWPVFGKMGTIGGSIFLDRTSRKSAWETVDRMAERLGSGVPVLFFPEGTSTDGSEVIRFHSTLFAAAIETELPVTPLAIFYVPNKTGSSTGSSRAGKGSELEESDLCWYGDDLFFPHLLRLLGVEGFTAVLRFGSPEYFVDRQVAAWRTQDAVAQLRARL
jgi:1-acyl-sn-glycerol-3-phosphate acyltransferase